MKTIIEPDWSEIFGTLRAFEMDQDSWGPTWDSQEEEPANFFLIGFADDGFEDIEEEDEEDEPYPYFCDYARYDYDKYGATQ